MDNLSVVQRIMQMKNATLTRKQRRTLNELPWELQARPTQLIPRDTLWNLWIYSGGRGSGKTRTGAEAVVDFAEKNPKSRILIVARTVADIRETILEGESGILSLYRNRNGQAPTYKPSIRRLTWPNGTDAFITSADEPDSLRGTQAHFAWMDEASSMRVTDDGKLTALENLRLATRLGDQPRVIVTTTPNETPALEMLHEFLLRDPLGVRLSEDSTFNNEASLGEYYLDAIKTVYEGTSLQRSQLDGTWPWPL
ncbi:terminase large subunit, ATPase domain [Microbacterium phage Cece]|nr:terminase large subunit, ATPase domain [Microbacterium phage Cece]